MFQSAWPYFFGMNLCAGWTADRIARRLFPQRASILYVMTAICAWLVLTHSIVLVCGATGFLTRDAAVTLTIAMSCAAWATIRVPRLEPLSPVRESDASSRSNRLLMCLAIGAVVVSGALWGWKLYWEPFARTDWDDQAYHAVYPCEWLRAGSFQLESAYNHKAYYPASGELPALWMMIPWRGETYASMAWVDLTFFPMFGLFVVATLLMLKKLDRPAFAAIIPIALFLGSWIFWRLTDYFSDVDHGLAILLYASLIAATPGNGSSERRRVDVETWLAALTGGLAIGIKPTAVVFIACVFVICCFRVRPDRRAVCKTIGIWAAAIFVTGSYWYLRNWVVFGNPLYPAKVLGLPGVIEFHHSRLSEFAAEFGTWTTIYEAIVAYFHIPYFQGVLWAFGMLLGVLGACGVPRSLTRSEILWCRIATAVTAVTVCALWFQPFSAGTLSEFIHRRVHGSSYRYVLGLTLIAWSTLALYVTRLPRRDAIVALTSIVSTAVLFGSLHEFHAWKKFTLVAISLGAIVCVATVVYALTQYVRHAMLRRFALGLCVLAVVVIPFRHKRKAAATLNNQLPGVFATLETLPEGTGVWGYDVHGWIRMLCLRGSRFQFQAVPLDENGLRAETLPITTDFSGRFSPGSNVSPTEFVANLRNSGVGCVLIVKNYTKDVQSHFDKVTIIREPFPDQREALLASGAATKIGEDSRYELWSILPQANAIETAGKTVETPQRK